MVDATRELTTNKTEIEADAHLNGPEADVRSHVCMYLSVKRTKQFFVWNASKKKRKTYEKEKWK